MKIKLEVDFKSLQKQKLDLLNIQKTLCSSRPENKSIDGIVNMFDFIQDQAVDVYGMSEVEVFGKNFTPVYDQESLDVTDEIANQNNKL